MAGILDYAHLMMMTALFLLLAGVFAPATMAQSTPALPPSPASGWTRVLSLPVATSLHVKLLHRSQRCVFATADQETLTCANGARPADVLSRPDIRSIHIAHRGRSMLVGCGTGAAIGFGVGFAIGTGGSKDGLFGDNFLRGAVAGVFAAVGAVLGAPIGYFTDFTSGKAIYQAP